MKQRARPAEDHPSESLETPDGPAVPEGAAPEGAVPEGVRSILEAADATRASSALEPAPGGAFGNLAIAQVVDVREGEIDVRVGGRVVSAMRAPLLHEDVLRTALETGEAVLVERAPDGKIVVVGALRTRPTPGVDKMKDVTIEADRIALIGRKEILLSTSGVARIALRAAGEIETYADRIVSRAEELHKIVGRMLRLN